MNDVSLFRLYLLRAMYLLSSVALGSLVWPRFFQPHPPWELFKGVVQCMLAAFSAVSLFGLRYPLQLLPLLLWELAWKVIWLLVVSLPLWRSGQLAGATRETTIECLWVVLLPLVIPWGYLARHYFAKGGDRWRPALR
jgi:hypothetical protein